MARRCLVAAALVVLILESGRTQAQDGAPQPLGRLVDVGGYRVHLYCVGSGSPTVVITGAGYSFDWSLVQPEVAKFTRVCAYDHSGIAWSDPGPADSCSLRIGEIHAALRTAEIKGPYVLVGHSLGALVSRLYASKRPDEVAGMVIVDHATAGLIPAGGASPRPGLYVLRERSGAPPAAPDPLSPGAKGAPPRLPPATSPDRNAGFEKLPERDYRLHVWANSLPGLPEVMKKNAETATACAAEVAAATQNQTSPLRDKPFIAVSAPGSSPLHTRLLDLSFNSKQVVAANSDHYVMVDRPDVVIDAIREVVEAAQNHTSLKAYDARAPS